jgi:hypothetical protein
MLIAPLQMQRTRNHQSRQDDPDPNSSPWQETRLPLRFSEAGFPARAAHACRRGPHLSVGTFGPPCDRSLKSVPADAQQITDYRSVSAFERAFHRLVPQSSHHSHPTDKEAYDRSGARIPQRFAIAIKPIATIPFFNRCRFGGTATPPPITHLICIFSQNTTRQTLRRRACWLVQWL